MDARSLDLKLATTIALAMLLMALLGVTNTALRVALGIPLALVLPGYTLLAALFPSYTLRGAEKLVFSLALSLVVAALGGFVLNVLPWGFQATAWAGLLGSITLVASGLAYRRRASGLSSAGTPTPWYTGITVETGLFFGLWVTVVIVAIWVARLGALQQPAQDFTQLWVLPASDTNTSIVRVGVHTMEATPLTYQLEVAQGDTLIKDWPTILLQPGATWEVQIALPAALSDTEPITVRLYRLDQPDIVYRQGIFWPRR